MRLRVRRGGPAQVIGALAGALTVAAVGLDALAVGLPAPVREAPQLPWLALAVLFGAAQAYGLVLQSQRESRVVFLSEIPFVLGLAYCSPGHLVLARVLAPAVLYGLVRRIRPLKLVFNLSLAAWEVSVGLLVFRLLVGSASPLGVRGWVACYAATTLSSGTAAIAVEAAVALADRERLRLTGLLQATRESVGTALMVTTVGIVVARALRHDLLMAVPLTLCGVILLVAYRAYSSLFERHLSMERLYRFSRAVGNSPEVDEVLGSVIEEAREMLHAERAEIVFVPDDLRRPSLRMYLGPTGALVRTDGPEGEIGAWLLDAVVRPQTPLLVTRDAKDEAERAFLAAYDLHEAVAVPLRGELGVIGLLLVGNRLGEIRGFDPGDVKLCETVANHAGVALRNGQLIGQLRHDARHDALTGLPNRVLLHEEIERAFEALRAGRSTGLAVLMMDLDGFKDVNDSLGHQQGDLLLKEVAARLRSTVGDRGVVARLGGDEFAVLLGGCSEAGTALSVAQAVLRALEEPVPLQEMEVDIAGSIGIALAPLHAEEATALLKRSDMAMYAAKADQRGVLVFDAELDTASPHRLALVGELRAALSSESIDIAVQPQADVVTGEVRSVEVLARWRHPVHGWVLPDEFIALAERTGLIRPLTQSVLQQALAATASWRRAGAVVSVAVNLSARSLLDDELELEVLQLLDDHGLPTSALTLEITESSVMSDPVRTVRLLERLRDRGIRLSVDDFGTGYSSLSYLRQLPIHEVKIDKSFVMRSCDDEGDQAIVRSIVDLGTNLGLDIVAEGVEDERVRQLLVEMGCTLMQGYHLARPMPPQDFPAWLAQREGVLRAAA